METPESSERRRIDYSGGSVCIENVERNDGGVDCKHKVFLCHSGEQKDFVESLHDEIERHDRSAFFDKSRRSLSLGCDFPREIFKAIEECEVGVVVLSQAFFMQTWWPMKEFARLAKRKEENKDFVLILVYYNGIELAECKDKNKQVEWKEEWENWARLDKRIVIEEWTSVFKLFGPTMAISYDRVGGAKRVIREVVAAVCKLVTPETRGDDLDMQGGQRMCELVWGNMQAAEAFRVDGPRVVGLYGMGGIGKSTVCKALCEKLRSEFGGRVCHAELPSNSDDGKENEVLGEMVERLIGTPHGVVVKYNKTERLNSLKEKIQSHKVFVAIDNVGEGASSKGLARDLLRAKFTKDSFVVVTARSIEMLQEVGVRDCHEMPELDYEEAESLFLIDLPEGVHLEDALIKKCVRMCIFSKGKGEECHYHPLALKVLRGELGCNREEWMARLTRRDPFNPSGGMQHPINSILRCSFDSLEWESRDLFMDVALFFPERRDRAVRTLKDVNIMTWLCVIHGWTEDDLVFRLKVLQQKSLIECIGDGTDVVGIHDLWREFCVTETGKDDRWFYRKNEILESSKESEFYGGGWKDLRRVCLSGPQFYGRFVVRTVSLQCCSNLTVLKLVNVELENQVVNVSPLLQLKSLEWDLEGVREKTWEKMDAAVDIQGLLNLVDLRVLILRGIPNNSACIGEIASLVCLEVLLLSTSVLKVRIGRKPGMTRILDLGKLRYLRFVRLNLGRINTGYTTIGWDADEPSTDSDEPGMTRLPDLGKCRSSRLVRLQMGKLPSQLVWSNMKVLQWLGLGGNRRMLSCNGQGNLTALVELDLVDCVEQKVLPCLGKLRKLEKLNISGCGVSAVPGLDCLVALQEFRAEGCTSLKRLPDLQRLSKLEVLDLRYCYLVEPNRGLEKLTSLRQLRVFFDTVKDSPKQCPLTELQDVGIKSWGEQGLPCMVGWTGLKRLEISDCCGVRKLEGLEILSSLQFLNIQGCDFRDVSIVSCLASLQELRICYCKNLEQLPSLVQLSKLESLELERLGLATWEVCGTIPQLRYLGIIRSSFISLPELGHFPELRSLALDGCDSLTCLTSEGPLAMLEKLTIWSCVNLESVPNFSGHFPELRSLTLHGCDSLTCLTSEGPLAMLENLTIWSCVNLESVPNFSGCTQLERVNIEDCMSLIPMPNFSGLERVDIVVRDGSNHSCTWLKENVFRFV